MRATVPAVLCFTAVASGFTAGCSQVPPTITPIPDQSFVSSPGTTIEMTVPAPPGVSQPGVPLNVPPLVIGGQQVYRDPNARFSMSVPTGWTPQVQPMTSADVKVGVLFPSPEANGLITVTHFDNGVQPTSVGTTATQILELTGVTKLPGFQEISRSDVIEREGQALRVELVYTKSDGVPMHSMVLFEINGTNFSMVNMSVEAGSWQANQGAVLEILRSYRVPAEPGA